MALVNKGLGAGIASQDVDQYFQLLQGLMSDTPVSIGNLLTASGSDLISSDLLPPTGVSVAPHGTAGTASHTYAVISRNALCDSATTGTASLTNSNSTLNTTNYNIISWTRQAGATSYVILRDGLVINTVADTGGSATGMTYSDQGGTGTTYTPLSAIPPGGRVRSGRGAGSGYLSLAGINPNPGPPTTGSWLQNDIVMDTLYSLYVCTAAGSPGTWRLLVGGVTFSGYAAAGGQGLTSGTAALVQVNTVNLDTASGFNTADYLYTCPVAGTYRVSGQFKVNGAAGVVAAQIWHSGALARFGSQSESSSAFGAANVDALIHCSLGDTLGLYAYVNAGGLAIYQDGVNIDNYLDIELVA
jgi:hypothetical protein